MMRIGRGSVLVLAAMLVLGASCSKKTPESPYDSTGSGLGESDLHGGSKSRSGSSLDEFQHGRLGAEAQGPLDDVSFDFDSSDLSSRAREVLDVNSQWLRSNAKAKVEIEGHTDSRGTVEYNLALGARRASSVRDYLVSLGIPAERLSTISYGKELQVCQEETESCWARNRRVHFAILG